MKDNIIDVLFNSNVPLKMEELAAKLNIGDDQELFKQTLKSLIVNGVVKVTYVKISKELSYCKYSL